MLKDHSSSAIVAVTDIARAQAFYGDTLGLESDGYEMEGVLTYRTGATRLVVYQSGEAGTNRANAVVWGCGDGIDTIVAGLEAKGVVFELYPEIGGTTLEGNIHVNGAMKMVWFKDPDGNILHLNNM